MDGTLWRERIAGLRQSERIFATEAALTSNGQRLRGALEVVLDQAILGLLLEWAAGFAVGNQEIGLISGGIRRLLDRFDSSTAGAAPGPGLN